MSNWNKNYGYDNNGNRTVIITEERGEEKYASLPNRVQVGMMKLMFFGGLALLMPLALLIRVFSGA